MSRKVYNTVRGTVYAPPDVDNKRHSMSGPEPPPAPPDFNIE